MTDRELMQMALDALETITSKAERISYYCAFAVEIEALRARLEQPSGGSGSTHLIHLHKGWCFLNKDEPVIDKSMAKCEPKREWVGLTKEDLETVHQELFNMSGWSFNTMAKAIEAKLKEKNNG
jgi:hypothetical protein